MYLITKQTLDSSKILPWYNIINNQQISFQFSWIFWFPFLTYNRPSFINVIAFNLNQPSSSIIVRSFIGEDTNILYMSESNIYLVANTYISGKNPQDNTIIAKIAVNRLFIRPIADTQVPGTTNNQFSLSQYRGYLRIATTSYMRSSSSQWTNNVYVLTKYLRSYGKLTDIAKTQKIYACRYVDNKLYMVTFRDIDPFFVISFSNLRLPKILGQLKIPGFSRHLYPYDDTTIVGIGRNTQLVNGRVVQLGLKLSLFDVSNPTNPTEISSSQLSQIHTQSIAEQEHKAFLMAPEKNLIVIPGSFYNPTTQRTEFNGIFVYYVDNTQLFIRGQLIIYQDPLII